MTNVMTHEILTQLDQLSTVLLDINLKKSTNCKIDSMSLNSKVDKLTPHQITNVTKERLQIEDSHITTKKAKD